MMASEKNIVCYQGEDMVINDTIFQSDGTTPYDITAKAISCVLHRTPGDGLPLVTKTVGSGIVITNGPQGQLTATIPSADTLTTLGIGCFFYRIELTDSGADAVPSVGWCSIMPK